MTELSLLEGPLYRLGRSVGLVRNTTNTMLLGLAIAAVLWIVLVALAFVEGIGGKVFSLSVVGAHVRLLIAIPLFFFCEAYFGPRLTTFVRELVRRQNVPTTELPALESEIVRIERFRDSWLPEAICLIAAVLFSLFARQLNMLGTTATLGAGGADDIIWTVQWFSMVCMTVFRFLMFRWLWRLVMWTFFLWRLSRLPLRLVPTNPDGVGGLGYLEVVHAELGPLIFALSAVQCASLAEEISAGRMPFEGAYPALAFLLVAIAVLFIGPMYIFAPKLYRCRVQGMSDYMALAARYVGDFDSKWIAADSTTTEEILGSGDLQSLADLGTGMRVVSEMSVAPVTQRLLMVFGFSALLPMVPLLLLKYPVGELATKFLMRMSGM